MMMTMKVMIYDDYENWDDTQLLWIDQRFAWTVAVWNVVLCYF